MFEEEYVRLRGETRKTEEKAFKNRILGLDTYVLHSFYIYTIKQCLVASYDI